MPDPDVIKRSVTSGDYAEEPRGGALFYAVYSWPQWGYAFPPSLEGLTLKESDYVTSVTPDHESLWAGAVATAVTKVSSLAWEIEGDIALRVKRGQELLLNCDAGRGWVSFISKVLHDYLLTNNGAFLEVVRATKSLNSQIVNLIPLDSLRCVRTGNPEIPVIYKDLKGREHELRTGDVIEFADMPSSRASLFGSGRCAAFRAYPSIYKLSVIEGYVSEKVSGRRPLAVHLVNGLNDVQLRSVLNTAGAEADARGAISFMGAIIASAPGDIPINLATIPLAELPDNFNRRDELDIAVLSYANNLGMDVQDIQPLTGRALGTGAQSEVLEAKSKGKGLAAFRQQFVQSINTWVLPDMTTMAFIEKDWRDRKLSAEVNNTTETYVADSVDKGILTPQQGLQALVDAEVYPDEFLPEDVTPDTSLADTDKPEDEVVDQPEAGEPINQEEPAPDLEAEAQEIVEKIRAKVQADIQPIDNPVTALALPQAGGMRLVIQRKSQPKQEEPELGGMAALMPMAMAMALMGASMSNKGMDQEDYMKLSEWIAQLRDSIPAGKPKPQPKPKAHGIEAVVGKDENGQVTITLVMPDEYLSEKQDQQPIIVNIPAPIINVTAPAVTVPAPVINMAPMKAPTVNLTPKIEVVMPDPKPAEFVVRRDNYGNVLGIQEKAG